MSIEDFMFQHGFRTSAQDLTQLGPYSSTASRRFPDADLASSALAGLYWQSFVSSDAFYRALLKANASSQALTSSRVLVAPQLSVGRYDLLVLDPGLPRNSQVRGIEISSATFRPADVHQGLTRSLRKTTPWFAGNPLSLALELLAGLKTQLMLVAPAPQTERLSVFDPSVTVDDGAGKVSTAGAHVECLLTGAQGVTAAFHGLSGSGWLPTVDGQPASVLRSDAITDSAFLETMAVPRPTRSPPVRLMSGVLPRAKQAASFVGTTSRHASATILSFDPLLPSVSKYRQSLIYTDRVSQPGDSGAALVTSDDYLVGFAFERTLINEVPEMCTWVWAQSVMNALKARLA